MPVVRGQGRWETIRQRLGGSDVLRRTWERLTQLGRRYRQHRHLLDELERHDELYRRDAMRRARRARRRSLVLLGRLMNHAQREEFKKSGHFHVVGAATGDRYRIRTDMIANIDVMHENGTVKYRLCVRPAGDVPVYDVMAAQLLHLQDAASERRFLLHANVLTCLPEDRVYFRSIWLA